MATTTPIIAEGEKPSFCVVEGIIAGGASGIDVVDGVERRMSVRMEVGVGAIASS